MELSLFLDYTSPTHVQTHTLLSSEKEVGKTRRSCFKDNIELFSPLPDGVCQGFCLSDAVLNIGVKRRGGGGLCVCLCMCVQKSPGFLFFREKECWHEASHQGRRRRSECSSAAPGLFHFICSVMSLVTAARGREI